MSEIQGVAVQTVAKEAAAIYRAWNRLIDAYHGGIPEAAIAVRMWIESRGTNDERIGADTATGVLSVTRTQETRFGVPVGTRLTPEGNVWLACVRYNYDTAWFLQTYPGLARTYADAYVFGGQLVSAIGIGAAGYLFKRAPRGITYGQFADWVAAQARAGNLPTSGLWGSQTLDKIVYRVRAMWVASEAARMSGAPNAAGAPVIPRPPSWLKTFAVPKGVAIGMESSGAGGVLVMLGLGWVLLG